jgi:1-aminocyclopropane-1-carboxylate deaminase/D-cysteine desulfhydrase-like pyridoxal-dependent ACC family enzyme
VCSSDLGKAMAGLIAAVREARVPDDGDLVFVATGGLPALLTPRYTDWVAAWP